MKREDKNAWIKLIEVKLDEKKTGLTKKYIMEVEKVFRPEKLSYQ